MSYTVKQLAAMAGVTPRTLHHYDRIGLLRPAWCTDGGYRHYEDAELLRLQQILFFKELGFPLGRIREILDDPAFDPLAALVDQRRMLSLEIDRKRRLIATIDETIGRLKGENEMTDEALYGGFTKEEFERYSAEARRRWGGTDAYRQSQERVKRWSHHDWTRVREEMDVSPLVPLMERGPAAAEVQAFIAKFHRGINRFYDCNTLMLRNLGEMYTQDARFAENYRQVHANMPEFLRDAIACYCDARS